MVRLDPFVVAGAMDSVASSAKRKFDAWPAKEQKRDTIRKLNQHRADMGLNYFEYLSESSGSGDY